MANLRSLGQVLGMYNNTTGYYPGGMAFVTTSNVGPVWPTRLRAFMNGNREVFLCPSRDDRFAWTDRMEGMVVPPAGFVPGYGYEEGERVLTLSAPLSYGYNAHGWGTTETVPQSGLGSDVSTGRPPAKAELRVNRVRIPAEMIAIADSNGDGTWDPLIGPDLRTLQPPGAIHRGGLNVLYCDGHVQWHDRKEITLPDDPSVRESQPPWKQILALWRNDHFGR